MCASSRLWPPVASECEPPTCASPHTAYSAGSSPSVSRTCTRLADYSLLLGCTPCRADGASLQVLKRTRTRLHRRGGAQRLAEREERRLQTAPRRARRHLVRDRVRVRVRVRVEVRVRVRVSVRISVRIRPQPLRRAAGVAARALARALATREGACRAQRAPG